MELVATVDVVISVMPVSLQFHMSQAVMHVTAFAERVTSAAAMSE